MPAAATRGAARSRALVLSLSVALLVTVLPPPGLAQPEPVENPEDACPDDVNPPAPFVDRADVPLVHVRNVDCAYNFDIAHGYEDETFRPRVRVRRDQFAAFLVRTLQAADVALPEPEDQGFEDIDGNVHEDDINILAQTGITEGVAPTRYGPDQHLRRDQTGSFVLRAAAYIEDVPLENLQRDDGPFEDLAADNVHRRNINGARVLNLTVGRTEARYAPAMETRRDQMASFLIRLLASLTGDQPVVPDELRASSLELEPADATNPAGTDHTVTATVRDHRDDPVPGADVRLEVYREDASTPTATFTGPEHTDLDETDADGEVRFTYEGPEFDAEDRLVACVLDPEREHCQVEDGDGEDVTFSGEPEVGARVHDTASKTWDDARVDRVVIDEDDRWALNRLGTDHTVTATVTDPDGEPVADAAIRFEVYRGQVDDVRQLRDEDDLADVTFSGPVEEADLRTGDDGRVAFVYQGPNEEAVDRIVACRAVRGSCLVDDEEPDTDGTQFTGDPAVGAEPFAVATKIWGAERPWPAEHARAQASGVEIAGQLGDGLTDAFGDAFGDAPVLELLVQPPSPLVEVEARDGDEDRSPSASDEVLEVPAEPVADVGLVEVFAEVDLDEGYAYGEATAADVAVLIDEEGEFLDPGQALVEADAVHVEAGTACLLDPGLSPTSEEALAEASEGTRLAGLRIAGEGVDGEPDPNTEIFPEEMQDLARVGLREVTPIDADGEATEDDDAVAGYRVRGLVVEVLGAAGDEPVAEIVVGEAEVEIDCAFAETQPGPFEGPDSEADASASSDTSTSASLTGATTGDALLALLSVLTRL